MSQSSKRELRCFYEDDLDKFKNIDTSNNEILENCYSIALRHKAFKILMYIIIELKYIDDYLVLNDLLDAHYLEIVNDNLSNNNSQYVIELFKREITKHRNKNVKRILPNFIDIIKTNLYDLIKISIINKNYNIIKYFYQQKDLKIVDNSNVMSLIIKMCIDKNLDSLLDYFIDNYDFHNCQYYLEESNIEMYEYALFKNKYEYFIDILNSYKFIYFSNPVSNLSFYTYNSFINVLEKVNDYEYNFNNSIIIEKICEYEEKIVFDKSKSYWVRYFIDNYPQIFLNNIDTIRNYKYKKDFTEKKKLCYTLNNEYYDLFKVLIIHSDKFDDFYELVDYYIEKYNSFRKKIEEFRLNENKVKYSSKDSENEDYDLELLKNEPNKIEFENCDEKFNNGILNYIDTLEFDHYCYFSFIFTTKNLEFIKKYISRFHIKILKDYNELESIKIRNNNYIDERLNILEFTYEFNDNFLEKIKFLINDYCIEIQYVEDFCFILNYLESINWDKSCDKNEESNIKILKLINFSDKYEIFEKLNKISYDFKCKLLVQILKNSFCNENLLKYIVIKLEDIKKIFRDTGNYYELFKNFMYINYDSYQILKEYLGDNIFGKFIRDIELTYINLYRCDIKVIKDIYSYGFQFKKSMSFVRGIDEEDIDYTMKLIDIILKNNYPYSDNLIKDMIEEDIGNSYVEKYLHLLKDEKIKNEILDIISKKKNYYLLKKMLQLDNKITSKIIKKYNLDIEKIQYIKDIEGEKKCVICLTNSPCVILIPCGHLNICSECSSHLDNKCPFDNMPYNKQIVLKSGSEEERFSCNICKKRKIKYVYPNCKHVTCSKCSFKSKCPICKKSGEPIKIYMET